MQTCTDVEKLVDLAVNTETSCVTISTQLSFVKQIMIIIIANRCNVLAHAGHSKTKMFVLFVYVHLAARC